MEPILLLLALGLVFHLSRAVGIACPSWRLARAEVARLRDEVGEGEVEALLQEAERALGWKPGKGLGQWLGLCLYFLFWNGHREMAAWRLIHGAERRRAEGLRGPEVLARLRRGLAEVGDLPAEKQRYWKECLQGLLGKCGRSSSPEGEDLKPLLREFLAELYDSRDASYIRLLTLHNKATHLFWLGLLLAGGLILLWQGALQPCGSLSYAQPLPVPLFLAGLGGGLLSRLVRVVHTKRLPTDYGAYWVPLFLSPVLGGLGALLGVLVVALGVTLKVLGEGVADLLQPPSVYGLGVALGFSERLFQGLTQEVEGRLLPKSEDRKEEGDVPKDEEGREDKPPDGKQGGSGKNGRDRGGAEPS